MQHCCFFSVEDLSKENNYPMSAKIDIWLPVDFVDRGVAMEKWSAVRFNFEPGVSLAAHGPPLFKEIP